MFGKHSEHRDQTDAPVLGFPEIRRLWGIRTSRGFSDAQMAKLTRAWGPIPAVLADYYKQLGAYEELNGIQRGLAHLVLPADIESGSAPTEDGYLVFYREDQGVYIWGIRSEDQGKDDPPVFVTEGDPDDPGWYLESESVSTFLISMAHFQALEGFPFAAPDFYEITPDDEALIRSKLRVACQPFKVAWGAAFYGKYDDDCVMITHDDNNLEQEVEIQLVYASGTKDHFDELEALLGGLGEPI